MLEFQLFRIKVYPLQGILFEQPKSPFEILKQVIISLPFAEFRRGMVWHIGNVCGIEQDGLYLRLGRTTKSTIEIYQDGNFTEQDFEMAPYTHVIVDIPLEVCAIAKKTKLSRTTTGTANCLIRLLNTSERARQLGADAKFEISEINDPTDFVSHLHESFAISKFWVTFSRRNAWDTNKDFNKPMERLLDAMKGEKGKSEFQGTKLKPDTLEHLARSAASTGNDATAWLQLQSRGPKVKKSLRGNPVVVSEEDVSSPEQRRSMLQRIREKYHNIRGKSGPEQ